MLSTKNRKRKRLSAKPLVQPDNVPRSKGGHFNNGFDPTTIEQKLMNEVKVPEDYNSAKVFNCRVKGWRRNRIV